MLDKEILKRIKKMSESELAEALDVVKVSDAPVAAKEEYIKAIESALGLKYAGEVAIQQYNDSKPDCSDMLGSY